MNGTSSVSRVAYFSMEVAMEVANRSRHADLFWRTRHSRGRYITLRSAADLGVPILAVSLLNRKGYFRQQTGRAWGAAGA
jgi:starch phosphorylase